MGFAKPIIYKDLTGETPNVRKCLETFY